MVWLVVRELVVVNSVLSGLVWRWPDGCGY